jgi:leucyl aminopeptidase
MHDERHRCGGYFAYSSKEEAMADLIEPAPAPAARVYALDRPAQVREMMARVSEPRLRAVIEKLSGFHNRYFNTETGVASSGWIKEEWSAIAKDRKDISVSAYAHTWPQPSIIATIKGSKEPETVIVLGGHADSIGSMWGGADRPAPGADDNASGIAVLTEALRTIVESGYRPERTVKFIAYAAEEVGLRGSKDIASAFKAQGVDVAGVVQFDMTSFAGSGNMIYLISDFTSAPQNKYLGRLIDEYVGIPWGETKCGYGCSDHASWTRSGFSASFPFEATKAGANGNIHSVRDTLASAGGNADHSTNFAKLAVAYVVETAKAGKAHLAASRRAQKAAH